MPTIGLLSLMAPVEPKKAASPKVKIPPSEATSQYPAVAAAGGSGDSPRAGPMVDGRTAAARVAARTAARRRSRTRVLGCAGNESSGGHRLRLDARTAAIARVSRKE